VVERRSCTQLGALEQREAGCVSDAVKGLHLSDPRNGLYQTKYSYADTKPMS
jgi:hypothetical protein